ncbi:hypothetical protein GCM10029992_65740 [Glycomyces albus]
MCASSDKLAGHVNAEIGDATVVDTWCAGDDFVAATVDRQGGSGGDGEATERLVWRIEGERLIPVTDCAEAALPESIAEFLECEP